MLADLLKAVTERGLDTRHLCYDIDDKDVGAIVDEGFLDHSVRVALQAGIDPIRAIEMATLNPATHFGMDKFIGSLTPHRFADVVLVEEIGAFPPRHVLFEGRLVGEDGQMIVDVPSYDYPAWYTRSITLHPSFGPDKLRLPIAGAATEVTARVIVVSDEAVYNRGMVTSLAVVDGEVRADPERDILKLCVIERYGKNGNVAVAFVKGFGLKRGAIGSSVAHDHHNLMVVGCSDEEIMAAARWLERMHGGWVAVNGQEEIAAMPLSLGGLMSDQPFEVAAAQRAELTRATAQELGCILKEPFPVLSFVGLPTVPELGLSDMGLIDVAEKKLVDIVLR
jgi:adenine deaminase